MTRSVPSSLSVVTLLMMTSALCSGRSVIDLSYTYKEGEDISWPIFPRYNFTILNRGFGKGSFSKFWLEYNKIEMAEHTGTHLDAPAHFMKDHWRVHEIPASRLIGPGVLVDVREKVKANIDYVVSVDDLKAWESQHGRIPDGAVVLTNTGWGSRYPDREKIFNPESGNVDGNTKYHFPAFGGETAQWLVDNRDVTALGVDTPSSDTASPYASHMVLLENDVLILENVANLDQMPADGTTVLIGGINIFQGSGAPARILAFVDHQDTPNAAVGRCTAFLMFVFAITMTVLYTADFS